MQTSTPTECKKKLFKLHSPSNSDSDLTLDSTFTGLDNTVVFKTFTNSQLDIINMLQADSKAETGANQAIGGAGTPPVVQPPVGVTPDAQKWFTDQLSAMATTLHKEMDKRNTDLQNQLVLQEKHYDAEMALAKQEIQELKDENEALKISRIPSHTTSSSDEEQKKDVRRKKPKRQRSQQPPPAYPYHYYPPPPPVAPHDKVDKMEKELESLRTQLLDVSLSKQTDLSILVNSIEKLTSHMAQSPSAPAPPGAGSRRPTPTPRAPSARRRSSPARRW